MPASGFTQGGSFPTGRHPSDRCPPERRHSSRKENPRGANIRAGVSGDRSQYYQDLSEPFYGANRPGNQVSQGMRDSFWLWSMQVRLKGAYDCIKAFSETDPTKDQFNTDLVAGLAVAVAAVLITAAGCGAAAPGGGKPKPTVILVHGAFADLTPDPAGAPARP